MTDVKRLLLLPVILALAAAGCGGGTTGTADSGERAPSGLYFVRLRTESGIRVGKVLLLP